ncbi:MAG: ribosome maturation factor RimM [Acetobacter sp.]|nr:ribosome maturation factor RimM [Acetobacter sp.]
MSEKRVCLGKIVGVHGIKGEFKVKSYTAIDRDIAAYGELEDKTGECKFALKVTGHSKDLLRIKIKGIDDRTTAESLIGKELYAPRGVLPELKSDEVYYEADLVGLKVFDEQKNEVAKVVGFYNFGAGDILEIKLKTGKAEMLPFNKSYVPEINLEDGYIIVASTGMVFFEDDEDLKDAES